jgi:hypothetical protein
MKIILASENVCASDVPHFNKLKLPRHYEQKSSGYVRDDCFCDLVHWIGAPLIWGLSRFSFFQ